MLYEVYENIWDNEVFLEDWKKGYFVKIFKRGNLVDCCNYRGIIMLFILVKIFNRIIF